MKVSYTWLQKYFKEQIPAPEKLADLFTFHSFEVEGHDGTMLDAKILPDRNPYCLSHRGIAQELHAITGAALLSIIASDVAAVTNDSSVAEFPFAVPTQENTKEMLLRYVGRRVDNLQIGESPEWLKKELTTIGARPINSVVDALNYVMYDIGQPLHAFDAEKVVGKITFRAAQEGEMITTLDGKEVKLQASDHVIADDVGPLAIAGVKGGKRAEVTSATKSIFIEAANFNSSAVRKTSMRTGIRNDSSKRFENGITSDFAMEGMKHVCAMISQIIPDAKFGPIMDEYPKPEKQVSFSVSQQFIETTIGVKIPEKDILDIFQRLAIGVVADAGNFTLTIPSHRLDLRISADIADEVGRLWGYEKVPAILPHKLSVPGEVNALYFYSEKIKDALVEQGFSEIYSYSLVQEGAFEVTYPLASDKKALRTSLLEGMSKSLELNVRNADFLELDAVKIFEIGTVFPASGEITSLSIGVKQIKKVKGVNAKQIVEALLQQIGLTGDVKESPVGAMVEINLSEHIAKLPALETAPDLVVESRKIVYAPFSPYPYIVRDIAAFVPAGMEPVEMEEVLREHAGSLLVKLRLVDVFEKKSEDGTVKKSLAFRLVFQAMDRTLTDEEVNTVMEKIYSVAKEKAWEVR